MVCTASGSPPLRLTPGARIGGCPTDSDRKVEEHVCWRNHHLNDTPGGTRDCHCPPDHESTTAQRLLAPNPSGERGTTNRTHRGRKPVGPTSGQRSARS